jgi:hypothetical protein
MSSIAPVRQRTEESTFADDARSGYDLTVPMSSARSHHHAAECDRLIALAEAMPAVAERRRALAAAWYVRLLDLTQHDGLESSEGENALDDLVAQLRRAWMATAHEYADVTYRSPAAGTPKVLPSRSTISYAYERSIEESPLDARLPAYRPVPAGWSARHLLFSSGMAALSGVMQSLPAMLAPRAAAPTLLAAVAYFESLDLIELGTHGCTARIVADDETFATACTSQAPDVAFIEPIVYDPRLQPLDVQGAMRRLAALPSPPIVIVDSTLVGPSLPLARILDEAPALPLVVQVSSGLKLDQAGLELANVGIVTLYAPGARRAELDTAADRLRLIRRLNGTALTIDTVALLDLPFFLDPATFYDYSSAVFAHNARLARAVSAGGCFERIAHPVQDPRGFPWAQAPFVFFHLRDDDPARYAELEALVIDACAAREVAIERGGSFGFRGHRCEAIVLEGSTRRGVFKVALGARSGPSLEGIIGVMSEIASHPTVADARAAFACRARGRSA